MQQGPQSHGQGATELSWPWVSGSISPALEISDCQAQKLRIPGLKGKPGAHFHPKKVASPSPLNFSWISQSIYKSWSFGCIYEYLVRLKNDIFSLAKRNHPGRSFHGHGKCPLSKTLGKLWSWNPLLSFPALVSGSLAPAGGWGRVYFLSALFCTRKQASPSQHWGKKPPGGDSSSRASPAVHMPPRSRANSMLSPPACSFFHFPFGRRRILILPVRSDLNLLWALLRSS